MIKDFLAKLGANTKITVGVSVSPGIGLEMIEIDGVTKTVSKYACKPLSYNYSTREIEDYEQFKKSLNELFEDLHIPQKSNVILTMPNVHFGVINLPLLLTDEAITNAIVSEVEQSYIFKRQEPVVSWVETGSNIDTENKELAYTAIQQMALDGIIAACQEVGCTVVCIESSYASLLKTLSYTDLAKEQMKDNITWNLMVIGQNNYSIFSMVGKKIIEYYEEPLALKSFVDDEIYNAINSSSQITLSNLPANYLYIVSETDLVSAEVLSMKIPFEGQIKFVECNKYKQNELMTVNLNIIPSLALKMTPEAIGSGIAQFSDFPLKFNLNGSNEAYTSDVLSENFSPRINIGNMEVELTQDFIKKVSLIICIIIILPTLIIAFVLDQFLKQELGKLDLLNKRVVQADIEISKYKHDASAGNAFDLNSAIEKISKQNRSKLFYYTALGMSIPNKLWVSYYLSTEDGGVDIKGQATDVQSIYTFYKGLKQLVINSNLKLYKLEISSESIDDIVGNMSSAPKYYMFEITNMSPEQLEPAKPSEQAQQTTTEQKDGKVDEKKPIFQFGKPIFGGKSSSSSDSTAGQEGLPKNLEKIEKF